MDIFTCGQLSTPFVEYFDVGAFTKWNIIGIQSRVP
jgi:hypothetical protein